MKTFSFQLLKILPKNLLSRIVGVLVHLRLPGFLRTASIRWFAQSYQIDQNEAQFPIEHYESIGDFFVRQLKAGARPIAGGVLVHPADALITQFLPIASGATHLVKGQFQTTAQLLGDSSLGDSGWSKRSGFFVTYYLCPTDYHRVHSPIDAEVTEIRHLPGKLWPVNEIATSQIPSLFVVNERVAIRLRSGEKEAWLVMVAATNVGDITLAIDDRVTSNDPSFSEPRKWEIKPSFKLKKGQEIGQFNMGSTVVMLYDESWPKPQGQWQQKRSQVGQAFD